MMKNTTLYISLLLNFLFIGGFFFVVHAMGGFSYLVAKIKTKNLVGVYQHRVNHLNQLAMSEDAIVMLGNSLTQACEWSELLENDKVVNRGVAGEMTGGLLLRLDEITRYKPSQIFMMIGINDLSVHDKSKILDNYKSIVTKILLKSPSTKLYLQSLLPVNNQVRNGGKSNADIIFLNEKIQELASENDLIYVNLHPLFLDEEGRLKANLTQDGIHLDAAGYLIWKKELQKYIN